MNAVAALLPNGRLHLQHGPIDCLCRAWGEAGAVDAAYQRAARFFASVLGDLCTELSLLRSTLPTAPPHGVVARRMHVACMPFSDSFITPMAAVAGAVADAVLQAMNATGDLSRAFVNNGGDIAFHLAPGTDLRCGLVTDLAAAPHDGSPVFLDGAFVLTADYPARGLATSGRACKGRGGRSFSLGIADSVSVLARTAAQADAAATIIGNAVDLPGHAAIHRLPASTIEPSSDLGGRLVTLDVGPLEPAEVDAALDAGQTVTETLIQTGLISGAVLALRGRLRIRDPSHALLEPA